MYKLIQTSIDKIIMVLDEIETALDKQIVELKDIIKQDFEGGEKNGS